MRREIETLEEFDAHVRAERSLVGCLLQALDLRGRADVLEKVAVQNAFFLGCRLKHRSAVDLAARGAAVFPRLPQVPFDAYRPTLYTPLELYSDVADGYPATTDARVYAWTLRGRSRLLDASLAQSLHDHFVSDALLEVVTSPGAGVGIMGGHSVGRGTPEYEQAARLGRGLADAGNLVMTGGGPGAMEAANLGASFRGSPEDLTRACAVLAEVPSFTPDPGAWAAQGFAVKERFDCTRLNVGVPTWFYGHEPPNVFPTLIAKYFDNAIREDILLRLCGAGLVYVPGRAGTTQEIFQALTRNYYALESGQIRPMVLLGVEYWTHEVPAWPLLASLARGRLMESSIHLVDTVDEVLEVLA
ncbi:Rossmann fold nucleotide-binding protein [Propioniciclava coleopterorum]|uniref:Rossmann fold nucleotide-binding protein n=1 Tax=Propioniciclava coleopterorum TaxID=2714937 RepID=A0A6G7Y8E9_9ACTN|nr:LOG family protein [Propioniciclava coleopterorum]QIK73092.1 Rossmann fold nucleotide-binding protein [Propioniciclava coleopterorum]